MRAALVSGAGIVSRRFGFHFGLIDPIFRDEEVPEGEEAGVRRFEGGAALVTPPQ
jgi:hypothetical protein